MFCFNSKSICYRVVCSKMIKSQNIVLSGYNLNTVARQQLYADLKFNHIKHKVTDQPEKLDNYTQQWTHHHFRNLPIESTVLLPFVFWSLSTEVLKDCQWQDLLVVIMADFWGNSLRDNPLARRPGQVKLDSDKWKFWKKLFE